MLAAEGYQEPFSCALTATSGCWFSDKNIAAGFSAPYF
jgi:hypothetical protein